MRSPHPFLASRLLNTPLALSQEKAAAVLAVLADRLGLDMPGGKAGALSFDYDEEPAPARPRVGYDNVQGVAVIGVEGILVQRSGFVRPVSGLTGYDGVRTNFIGALRDPDVRAIAFDINSPGGEVDGLFSLVDLIYEARGVKPIHAIAADHGYSAAYAIASAADKITVPRTGGVGSVGVIAMLVDASRAVKQSGMTVHFLHHGEEKARLTREQVQGVSPELLTRLQSEVDMMGQLFVETVARNRNTSRTIIKNYEGDYFLGADAVKKNLADQVAAPDEAFGALLAELDAA